MKKSTFIKTLFITSCSVLTMLAVANAEQPANNYNKEGIVSIEQKLLEKDHATLEQVNLDGDNDSVLDKHDQCPNSPVGNEVDIYGCTKYTEIEPIKEKVMTISLSVHFENDDHHVDEKYFSEIKRVAHFLKQYPSDYLIIEGHTSSQGNAEYNKKLSQKRATEIVNILTNEFNIDSNRLSAIGYGEEQLIDLAETTEAHSTNRRVEAKVSKAK